MPPKKKTVKTKLTKGKVKKVLDLLEEAYPEVKCALNFKNAYQLLVATILSAQCTDARVNLVTPGLFKKYPNPKAISEADPAELEEAIRSTGFFRQKAKSLINCFSEIVEKHKGKVPEDMDVLVKLAGVGRKTANVIRGNAYGLPGIVVDTHVKRLSNRIGFSENDDPEKIEKDLCSQIPEERWTKFSHQIQTHGRLVCSSRKPLCMECTLNKVCLYPDKAK